jgi:hypothetical protein
MFVLMCFDAGKYLLAWHERDREQGSEREPEARSRCEVLLQVLAEIELAVSMLDLFLW